MSRRIQAIKMCYVVLVRTSHIILPHIFVLNAKKIFAKTVNMVMVFSEQLETILYHHYNEVIVKIDFFQSFFFSSMYLFFREKVAFRVFRLRIPSSTGRVGMSSAVDVIIN